MDLLHRVSEHISIWLRLYLCSWKMLILSFKICVLYFIITCSTEICTQTQVRLCSLQTSLRKKEKKSQNQLQHLSRNHHILIGCNEKQACFWLKVSFSWILMTTFIVSCVCYWQRQPHTLRLHYGKHWHQQLRGLPGYLVRGISIQLNTRRRSGQIGAVLMLLLWKPSQEPSSHTVSVFL